MKTKYLIALLTAALSLTAHSQQPGDTLLVKYRLHGQSRNFKTVITDNPDGSTTAQWTIVRNLVPWHGSFTTTKASTEEGNRLNYTMPEDGNNITLPDGTTHLVLSLATYNSLVNNGQATIDGTSWELTANDGQQLTACDNRHGAVMTVKNDPQFPLVTSMTHNPLEVDWTIQIPAAKSNPTARQLIEECPERSGGVYYAYPVTHDVMPDIPDGYRVTHLSHYGRHGSRWLIKTWTYDEVLATLDSAASADGLTELGRDVHRRVGIIAQHAQGHKGELSPLGARQHKAIAQRMALRFPTLFTDSSTVVAYSSTEPRCIISMAAFSERLKEMNPSLNVQRHATPGDMDYISRSTPQTKALNDPANPWWRDLDNWRDSQLDASRLTSLLFTDPQGLNDPKRFVRLLHDIAVDCQDVNPGVELLDLFTFDEMYPLWGAMNYKMYYITGNNPAADSVGSKTARTLVINYINDIDSALTHSRPGRTATLRFGHDTAMLRMLAAMKINGADVSLDNPDDYADHWQDFNLTPMAANLQVILLESNRGQSPLVMIRHNETPATLPLPTYHGGYYRWDDVKSLWLDNK